MKQCIKAEVTASGAAWASEDAAFSAGLGGLGGRPDGLDRAPGPLGGGPEGLARVAVGQIGCPLAGNRGEHDMR